MGFLDGSKYIWRTFFWQFVTTVWAICTLFCCARLFCLCPISAWDLHFFFIMFRDKSS